MLKLPLVIFKSFNLNCLKTQVVPDVRLQGVMLCYPSDMQLCDAVKSRMSVYRLLIVLLIVANYMSQLYNYKYTLLGHQFQSFLQVRMFNFVWSLSVSQHQSTSVRHVYKIYDQNIKADDQLTEQNVRKLVVGNSSGSTLELSVFPLQALIQKG